MHSMHLREFPKIKTTTTTTKITKKLSYIYISYSELPTKTIRGEQYHLKKKHCLYASLLQGGGVGEIGNLVQLQQRVL